LRLEHSSPNRGAAAPPFSSAFIAAVIQPTDLLVLQRDGTTCRATAADLLALLSSPGPSRTAGRLWDLVSTPADNDWRAVCWAP
jgi:hypothetical protein